jgi:hypothetical protein
MEKTSEVRCQHLKEYAINHNSIRTKLSEEIERLSTIKKDIKQVKIGMCAYTILAAAVLISLYNISQSTITFMVLWITASLYFYLLYPILPLILFPIHQYTKRKKISANNKPSGKKASDIINWAFRIKIIKNRKIGIRLVIRFFLFSLLPLTAGIILIYCSSLIFSLILGYQHQLPGETALLIIIQCLGILLFYLEVFYLRHHLYSYAKSFYRHTKKNPEKTESKQNIKTYFLKKNREILFIAIIGVLFLIIASILVIILLVAILLPGITLGIYVNVTEFVQVKTNIWIAGLIFSQIIFMQYLQSILSRRIAYSLCEDLITRLNGIFDNLPASKGEERENNYETDRELHIVPKAISLLTESKLHAINHRQMLGLFPTYSIGVDIPTLLNLENLDELRDIIIVPD